MRLRWTIGMKLFFLALVASTFLFVVAAAGYVGMSFESSGREILHNQALMRNHLEADNAHDSIRGDIYAALEVGTQKASRANGEASTTENNSDGDADLAALEKNVVDKFQAHKAIIKKNLALLDAAVAGSEVKQILAASSSDLTNYVSSAEQLLNAALSDPQSARLSLQSFLGSYEALSGSLQRVSDALQQRSTQSLESERSTALRNRSAILTVATAALAILVLLCWLIGRSITRRIKRAVHVAGAVARGDLTQRVDVSGADEIADLLSALKIMNEGLQGKVASIAGQINQTSAALLTASRQLVSGNADLSTRTEQQASTVEETAANTEHLTSTVQANAQSSSEAKQLAELASNQASNSGEAVSRVVETMQRIRDSSLKVAEIISVIDSIAFQTNILALNAAVEAARAGDQGRGFAVVASEVRSLAQRSAEAAREIKRLIQEAVLQVEHGSGLASDAGQSMGATVDGIRRVTSLIFDIARASQDQSAGIGQLRQAMSHIEESTQQNAALVEQASAAAESIQQHAKQLVELSTVFNTGVQSASQREPIVKKSGSHDTLPTIPTKSRLARPPESAPADEWTSF